MRFVANIVFANFSKVFERVETQKGAFASAAQSYANAKSIPTRSLNAGTNTGTLCSYADFRIPRSGNPCAGIRRFAM